MINYDVEVVDRNFYVVFSKDGKNVDFIHLTKDKLSYESILELVSSYESGFAYFGWSDSLNYRVLTIRRGFVVDDVSLHCSSFWLKFDFPKPVKGQIR